MNSIIGLCVLSVIFSVQAQAESGLFDDVADLKNYVGSITNDLSSFERNLTFGYYVQLSDRKIQHYENIDHSMTYTLDELKNATKAAAAEGRDITHCYQTAKQNSDIKSKVTFRKLDTCMKIEWHIVDPILGKIRGHLQKARAIHGYLNSIVLVCSSGTNVQVASCVAGRIPAAKLTVQSYESLVEEYKERGAFLAYSGVINYFKCADPSMEDFYDKLREARQKFNECNRDTE